MIYYCPTCHYIYPATTARDRSFCLDCGMTTPRPATEEEQARYEADRESVKPLAEKK